MDNNKILQGVVTTIYVKIDIQDAKTINSYKLKFQSGIHLDKNEEFIFSDKQELIESL